MPRTPIPIDTMKDVLVRSRRRCCICFGLFRNTSLKQGQVAHLDHNASNNKEDNLAFLCLEHHDQYDGRTSQSKGFTLQEVKYYREELYTALDSEAKGAARFFVSDDGAPQSNIKVIGKYIRVKGGESAEIVIEPAYLGIDRYRVSGYALYGVNREYGPNMGEINFIGELTNDLIEFSEKIEWQEGQSHEIKLRFLDNVMLVEELNYNGVHGHNVNFIGEYLKVT